MRAREGRYKKIKLKTNIPDGYECKNPLKKNTNQANSTPHQKNHFS
jgi:hypothetical protein